MPLPLPNATKSFWIEGAASPLRDHQTTESLPTETDVLIIGSGYTGTTIAYWLTQFTDTPPSITVLEARDICGGATGRNGGQLKPSFYISYPAWRDKHGAEIAKSLIAHEVAHLDAFENLVKAESIDCALHVSRSLDALMSDVECARAFGALDALEAEQGKEWTKDIGDIIKDPIEAERFTRLKGCQGALSVPAGSIWPYKFIHGLLTRMLDRKQITLHAHTPALSMSGPDTEGYTAVTTPRGVIRAKRVIHATNRWVEHLLPQFSGVIRPAKGTLAAIKVEGEYLDNPFKTTCGQRWDGVLNNYFIQLPPPSSTIILGGAKEVIVKDMSHWIDNDEEDKQIPGVEEYFREWPKRDLIGWDGKDIADMEYDNASGGIWTGIMSHSIDAFPFVGQVPELDGHYVSAGFHGHGMPRILLASAHLAPLILDSLNITKTSGPAYTARFPPLPKPFQLTADRMVTVRALAEERAKVDAAAKAKAKPSSDLVDKVARQLGNVTVNDELQVK